MEFCKTFPKRYTGIYMYMYICKLYKNLIVRLMFCVFPKFYSVYTYTSKLEIL